MKSTLLFVLLLFIGSNGVNAQESSAVADSTSLQSQYQTLVKRSKTFQNSKLINPSRLWTVWKSAMDSLSVEKKKVKDLQSVSTAQTIKVDSLTAGITQQQKMLETSRQRIDEISLLGFPVSKSIYNLIMWGLVIILAIAFTVVFIRSAGHRKEARYRIQLCDDLTEEFQAYKVKSNEKEKKLARELQDERNKLDDLTKR